MTLATAAMASTCSSADDGRADERDRDIDERDIDERDIDERDIAGYTPLMRAAIDDDADAVVDLLDAGADRDASGPEGLRAWHLAAIADAVDAVAALDAAGADLEMRSVNGMATLDHAAAAGSVRTIDYLLTEHGSDPDRRSGVVTQGHGWPADRGPTPLGIAVRAGHLDAVVTLLDAGADVDARSASGTTPLLTAVFTGQRADLVAVLLDAGADPTVVVACDERCSEPPGDAVEWARRLDRADLIPLLNVGSTG